MSFEDGNFEDDFDYQEGIGDLLKEKEKVEFSWLKTIIVAISLVTIVGLCFSLIFRIGKTLIVKPPVVTSQKLTSLDSQANERSSKKKAALFNIESEKEAEIDRDEEDARGSLTSAVTQSPIQDSYSQKTSTSSGLYRVVVAAFFDYAQAKEMLAKLGKKGVDGYVWTYKGGDRPVYRIQVGAFKDPVSAKDLESKMLKKGLEAYIIQK